MLFMVGYMVVTVALWLTSDWIKPAPSTLMFLGVLSCICVYVVKTHWKGLVLQQYKKARMQCLIIGICLFAAFASFGYRLFLTGNYVTVSANRIMYYVLGVIWFYPICTMILMALEAKVELYKAGVMTMAEFAALPRTQRDILVRVIVPKGERKVVYLSQRNTKTDIPVLTCAAVKREEKIFAVVGARPRNAERYDGGELLDGIITEESAAAFGAQVAGEAAFGSNTRAGGDYRRKVAAVLVRRAVLALQEQEG